MPSAPVPTPHDFDSLAEPHRHELQVHAISAVTTFLYLALFAAFGGSLGLRVIEGKI